MVTTLVERRSRVPTTFTVPGASPDGTPFEAVPSSIESRGIRMLPPESVTIGTASVMLAGANASRKSLWMSNRSATETVFPGFGSAAVSGAGIAIPPLGSIALDHVSCTAQAIYGLATGAGVVVAIQQGVVYSTAFPTTYSFTNLTTDRSIDLSAYTFGELVDVLGTIVTDVAADLPIPAYTILNLTALRALVVDTATQTELARVIGTVITDLVAASIQDYTVTGGTGLAGYDADATSLAQAKNVTATFINDLIAIGRLT